MDICRTLLCAGFALLVWNLQFRRIRPIRDFLISGINYPFHLTLMAMLILFIWGVIGESFGAQGLFLENDPPTQILLGGGIMLLFATLILHYSVLDSPGRWWNNSLKTLIGVIRNGNRLMPPEYPVQRILRNGFLEKLDQHEIEIIYDLAYKARTDDSRVDSENARFGSQLIEMLRGEPFRLLVSPAILLINGFMLVLLVGVVPSVVVPLFAGDSVLFRERLPWLVGVILGDLLGIFFACVTTRWAARAAGWELFQGQLLESIRALTDSTLRKSAASSSDQGDEIPNRRRVVSRENGAEAPHWVSLLFTFFVIHFFVNIVLPESLTSRWIEWPEHTYIDVPGHGANSPNSVDLWTRFPWLPVFVLLSEGAGAIALLHASAVFRRSRRLVAIDLKVDWFNAYAKLLTRVVLDTLSNRSAQIILFGFLALLAALCVLIASLTTPLPARSLWDGLRGALFLGSFLGLWLLAFRLATWFVANGPDHRVPRWGMSVAILVLLVLLYLAGTSRWLVVLLTSTATLSLLSPSFLSPSFRRGTAGGSDKQVRWLAILVTAVGATFLTMLLTNASAVATAIWISLSILVTGATAMIEVARRRPTLLYPLTLILAFTTFSVTYNALDERWQSAMPAAGSVACMASLIASVYTIIAFFWPKATFRAAAVVVAILFLLNGNAWFVAPNQFKTTFPNMQAYYALPVYLKSRDYFRDTTPSAVQLRNRKVTRDVDRLDNQGESQRLATAYFQMLGQHAKPDGGHAIRISVEDPRGRLRTGVGDEVQLVAEEWYTTLIDGEDCIVLAEEPFYRKIYRWFRYEKLQLVRSGIVRGQAYSMRPAVDASQPRPSDSDEFSLRYEPLEGPGDRLGLRLRKLASAYQEAAADYVLISMYWSGRVAAVTHAAHMDMYEVEFDIPPGNQPLDEAQMHTMSIWLERCHLDSVRPVTKVDTHIEMGLPGTVLPQVPAAVPGDCLVLEEARDEAPVPVGLYLAGASNAPGRSSSFAPYWPTAENLARNMEKSPLPAQGTAPAYTLRLAHDRGFFARPRRETAAVSAEVAEETQRPIRIALYNSNRVRPGDRLILSWNSHGKPPGPGEAGRGGIFEIQPLEIDGIPEGDAESLPPGYRWTTLLPVTSSGTPETEFPSNSTNGEREIFVGEWQLLNLLNNTEVLLSWKRLVGELWTHKKPKLVIVTVSGGGIRASVWTSVVLHKLERTLGADFPFHIRLITGASGGMVGGSYYSTSLKPPSPAVLHGGPADFSALHGITGGQFVDRMAANQLDAVAGRLVFADLISPLNPFLQNGDRGKTLEQTWMRWTGGERQSPLGRSLQSYAADERLGRRPSLVYTPMMVEDGRRLLVSNLDLAFATRNVAGLLIEPSSRMIERRAFQGDDLDRTIHDEDDVLSLSSVEFFRLFPESHDFRVTTAARMSASFPWVSPAISLPTSPPRRVVDAGYYDNYGVNLAALWLSKMRPWLEANTSGVIVLQIRDHVSQDARTEIDFDRLAVTSALDRLTWHAGSELLAPGMQAISTPLLGISNARQWSMSFRNDEQVDLLDLLFDGANRDFFRTVVFECPVDVSLNWQLSTREKDVLASGFGQADADPREELARTRDYLVGPYSYEIHKWMVDHRNEPNFEAELKIKYAEQLRRLGIRDTDHLSVRQSQQLYENIMMNLKRLELLRDWWRNDHVDASLNR